MLYLFWYNTFKRLFINVLYNYLRQGAVPKGAAGHKNTAENQGCHQSEKQYFEQGDDKYCTEEQREKEFCKSHGVFVLIVIGICRKTDGAENYFKVGEDFLNLFLSN